MEADIRHRQLERASYDGDVHQRTALIFNKLRSGAYTIEQIRQAAEQNDKAAQSVLSAMNEEYNLPKDEYEIVNQLTNPEAIIEYFMNFLRDVAAFKFGYKGLKNLAPFEKHRDPRIKEVALFIKKIAEGQWGFDHLQREARVLIEKFSRTKSLGMKRMASFIPDSKLMARIP